MGVFISYRRSERDKAQLIKQILEELNYNVFLDTENIGPGEPWLLVLQRELLASDAVVALVSQEYNQSEMCRFEAYAALVQGTLVPIAIDPALRYQDLADPLRQTNIPLVSASLADTDEDRRDLKSLLKQAINKRAELRQDFAYWQESNDISTDTGLLKAHYSRAWVWVHWGPRYHWKGMPGVSSAVAKRFHSALDAARAMVESDRQARFSVGLSKAFAKLAQHPKEFFVRNTALTNLYRIARQSAPQNTAPLKLVGDLAAPFMRPLALACYDEISNKPNDLNSPKPSRILRFLKGGLSAALLALIFAGLMGLGIFLARFLSAPPPPPVPEITLKRLEASTGGASAAEFEFDLAIAPLQTVETNVEVSVCYVPKVNPCRAQRVLIQPNQGSAQFLVPSPAPDTTPPPRSLEVRITNSAVGGKAIKILQNSVLAEIEPPSLQPVGSIRGKGLWAIARQELNGEDGVEALVNAYFAVNRKEICPTWRLKDPTGTIYPDPRDFLPDGVFLKPPTRIQVAEFGAQRLNCEGETNPAAASDQDQ